MIPARPPEYVQRASPLDTTQPTTSTPRQRHQEIDRDGAEHGWCQVDGGCRRPHKALRVVALHALFGRIEMRERRCFGLQAFLLAVKLANFDFTSGCRAGYVNAR